MSIDDFLDMMPETITIEPFASRDQFGVAAYGAPVSIRCRIGNKNQRIRQPSGEEAIVVGEIWAATVQTFSVDDRLTLPDGTVPVILAVDSFEDETGPYYTKFLLGDKHVYNVR